MPEAGKSFLILLILKLYSLNETLETRTTKTTSNHTPEAKPMPLEQCKLEMLDSVIA